jgi:hypothetical protein
MRIIKSGSPDRRIEKGDLFFLEEGEEIRDSSWDQRGEDLIAPPGGCWVQVLSIGNPHVLGHYLILSDEEKSVLTTARAEFPASQARVFERSINALADYCRERGDCSLLHLDKECHRIEDGVQKKIKEIDEYYRNWNS